MVFLAKGGGTPKRKPEQFKTTTLRQFDGGWNVIDHELNLTPRFATIFDNVVRGPDGSVSVRYGYELYRDLKLGTEIPVLTLPTGTQVGSVVNSKRLVVTWAGHPFNTGDHITFNNFSVTMNGVNLIELNGIPLSVRRISASSFDVITHKAFNAGVAAFTYNNFVVMRDTHAMGGRGINATTFNNKIILVSQAGEILTIDSVGTVQRIWDNGTAFAMAGTPASWGPTDFVSFNVFGGKLQLHNGSDKPLELDFNTSPVVQYLGDPAAGGSNAFTPIGYYSTNTSGYTVIAGKPLEPNELSLSGHLTQGVWTGNPDPDDAVDIDMGKVSNTSDAAIKGVIELRNKLVVAFRDALSIGTLGIVTPTTIGSETINVHEPDFKDTIAQHGTISHRTMVSLGNDILMCDRVGVPSVAQSEQSGQYIPSRVSELIEPALQANLSRLTDETLEKKAFAVYNTRDKQYMLFVPKYDTTDVRSLTLDPISLFSDLGGNTFLLQVNAHNFEEGDTIVITGATDIGANLAGKFNGTWKVNTIINEDFITVFNPDFVYPQLNLTGGGGAVKVQPINNSVVGYILTYNPKLRIKAWARFKDLDFDWGCKSINGRVFFGKGGKIYQFGTSELPFSADAIGDYDSLAWIGGTTYQQGHRIKDSINGVIWKAAETHTAGSPLNFATERLDNPGRWELYTGRPIKFTWEWPWGDFDKRLHTKAIRAVMPDVGGSGRFVLRLFVDKLYKDKRTGSLKPARTLEFVGEDAGGYGQGQQSFGAGRRTKEQLYWPVPVNGKLVKFRVEGETTDPLRFIAFSIVYQNGSLKR